MTLNSDVDSFDPEASNQLIPLQSKDHEEILDVIDQLRSEGVSKYVNLPQLIVCGDQSSGKSSVLEAISGLSFPRRDNVCTRFATELILRRASESGVTASLYPDADRPAAEQARLRDFKSPTLALNHFGEIVKSAEDVIGVGKEGFLFSKDVLRVEVSGPTQPHLTLVDLPGLYHASDQFQNEEGVEFVEELVLSYMENPRSVMMAVISAKSDIALQKVTSFTRKVDPKGERTMGIITKPDTLSKGSEMEQSFYNLARNKRVPFRLGWHVLKNRTFEERKFSLKQRNESEANFLAQGIWSSLPRNQVGIDSLRPRLSTVLKDHILSQMPGFIAETKLSFNDTRSSLLKLGEARQTLSEQRRYLFQSSEKFSVLIRNSINGTYFDAFFGDPIDDSGYERRLRAVIQNRLSDFSAAMRERGQHRKIIDDGSKADNVEGCISRTEFIEEVRQRMRRSRGRELPGTFNPLIIGDLFYLQSRPWEAIVGQYTDILIEDTRRATMPILQEVLDERSVEGLLNHVVNPQLGEIEAGLRAKTAELLQPQQMGHPITYNQYFIETVQKSRDQHLHDSVTEKLRTFFGNDYPRNPSFDREYRFSMTDLINALGSQTETDMERFAGSEAIDCMVAYYRVARKKFVDDFSNLAVERCLLEPLLAMFGPRTVEMMSDEVIKDIASEDENTSVERKRLTEKLGVLERSLARLNRLDRHNLTAPRNLPDVGGTFLDKSEQKDALSSNEDENMRVDDLSSKGDTPPAMPETVIQESPPAEVTPPVAIPNNTSIRESWLTGIPSSTKLTKKKKRHPSAEMFERERES